jgi:hypothetical protein
LLGALLCVFLCELLALNSLETPQPCGLNL